MRMQLTTSQRLQQLLPTLAPDLQALARRALKTENALRTVEASVRGTLGTVGMALDYVEAVEVSVLQFIKKEKDEAFALKKIEEKFEPKKKTN